jgi:hypothetical protein
VPRNSVDISSLVLARTSELATRSTTDRWAACASLWARVYVLASPGWTRWPDVHARVRAALPVALARCTGVGLPASYAQHIAELNSFEIEDDGSAAWQRVIDLLSMLLVALEGQQVDACVETAIRSYLEGTFNIVANQMAEGAGRPISQRDAEARMPQDETWQQTVAFVRSL